MNIAFVRLHARSAVSRAARVRPFTVRKRPRRLTSVALALAGVLLVLLPSCAGAQTWRTIDASRMVRDTEPVAVKVQYGAGRLSVRGADAPYLYRAQLRYDEARARALSTWDSANRTLTVGVDASGGSRDVGGKATGGTMTLALTRALPIDLQFDLGVTESTLELGGLRLRTLRLRTGASETRVRFDSPSTEPMTSMEVDAGAAAFHATGLANSGTASIRVTGGLGLVDLDFGGTWRRDIALELTLAVGGGELTVPAAVGVRLSGQKTMGSYQFDGMREVGPGVWETSGFTDAKHKLTVKATTTLGALKIVRR